MGAEDYKPELVPQAPTGAAQRAPFGDTERGHNWGAYGKKRICYDTGGENGDIPGREKGLPRGKRGLPRENSFWNGPLAGKVLGRNRHIHPEAQKRREDHTQAKRHF